MKNELKDGLDFAALTIGVPTTVLIFTTVWLHCSNKFALFAASMMLLVAVFYIGTVYEYMRSKKARQEGMRKKC